MYGGFGVQPKDVCGRVSIWTKDGGSLSQKFGWPVELVGLFGSGLGDKEGLLGVLDYLGPAAETSFGCPSGVLDCLCPALLTGKGVSAERVGLFGSGC